jgi:hypothetical protein
MTIPLDRNRQNLMLAPAALGHGRSGLQRGVLAREKEKGRCYPLGPAWVLTCSPCSAPAFMFGRAYRAIERRQAPENGGLRSCPGRVDEAFSKPLHAARGIAALVVMLGISLAPVGKLTPSYKAAGRRRCGSSSTAR